MARVNRIVEIDAGEDGEDVGLQERDQQLERRKRDGQAERQDGAEPAEQAGRAEHGHESAEHFQRDVASQHVGEQPHAVRDRSRQERHHLDEGHQRQDVDRNAGRHEQLEEAQPVPPETVDHHGQEDQQRESNGDDDVTGNREGVRNDADNVHYKDEHEQRENQRKEFHPLAAGGGAERRGDELVGHFGDGLQPAGDQRARTGSAEHQQQDEQQTDQHI